MITQLSDSEAQRLVQSTGNLYWTSTSGEVEGTALAIFRASKSSMPGQEIQIYSEPGAGDNQLAALTFAKVGSDFYGYFAANYPGLSQIKRIPLAGGPAMVLATSPAPIGYGDLVTDGSFLCWADEEGIRSMPIGGGSVAALATGTGYARLAMFQSSLFYVSAEGIMTIPARGGTPATVVTADSAVTALSVAPVPLEVERAGEFRAQGQSASAEVEVNAGTAAFPDPEVFWGQGDGAVNSIARGKVVEYQASSAGLTVTSVTSTATGVVWADQFVGSPGQGYSCHVRMATGGSTTILYSVSAELNMKDVQADEVAAYWPDFFVYKYTF